MKTLIELFRKNWLFIVLAFCIHVSPMPSVSGAQYLYFSTFAFIIFYALKHNRHGYKPGLFWGIICICVLSSMVNLIFDIRLLLFGIALIALSPITYSLKLAIFRERLLRSLLMATPILAIISLYCYKVGINMIEYDDVLGIDWNFCALYGHPMFLSAIMGLSTVVCTWNALSREKIYLKIFWIVILLLSIYLTVISASRTALTASLICMVGLIICNAKNIGRLMKYGIVISMLAMVAVPIYYEKSGRIQNKMENSSGGKYGSRTGLFDDGFEHFVEQPILGCGFAVQYRDGQKNVGRFEAGSGWLSILFQTGVLGASMMLGILMTIKRNIKGIRTDTKLQFFVFSFVYLCLHSCFEGYILTVGNFNFVIFWLLVSFLYTYRNTCFLLKCKS